MTGRTFHQASGVRTTPYGPNRCFTVQIQVTGVRVGDLGGARALPERFVRYRVVTPLSQSRAVALAILDFKEKEPRSVWKDIEVVLVEDEFDWSDEDFSDVFASGR